MTPQLAQPSISAARDPSVSFARLAGPASAAFEATSSGFFGIMETNIFSRTEKPRQMPGL